MKKLMMLLTLMIIFAKPDFAAAGQEGGGGQGIAFEVKDLINEVYYRIISDMTSPIEIDNKAFAQIIADTKIVSQPHVFETIDGISYETDALNIPARKIIIISETRFPKLDRDTKVKLIFHEYLGIMGLEKKAYDISALLDNGWVHPLAKIDGIKFRSETNRLAYRITRVSDKIESPSYFASKWCDSSSFCHPSPNAERISSLTIIISAVSLNGHWPNYADDADFSAECSPYSSAYPDAYMRCSGIQTGYTNGQSYSFDVRIEIKHDGSIDMFKFFNNGRREKYIFRQF